MTFDDFSLKVHLENGLDCISAAKSISSHPPSAIVDWQIIFIIFFFACCQKSLKQLCVRLMQFASLCMLSDYPLSGSEYDDVAYAR